jgi:hypothetical protein
MKSTYFPSVPGFHGLGIAVTKDRLAESEELHQAIKLLRTARRGGKPPAGVPDLQLRVADLSASSRKPTGATERARDEARILDERLTRGQRVLADVFNSPSWRLTKPLRSTKHLLSR